MNEYYSVWSFIRVSGFLAFYFMSFSLSIGLLNSLSIMKKKKALFLTLHQTSGWYGLLTIIFHMVLIWQDRYVPYSLGELFIPFYSQNEPIYSGLGTLSFYLFFLVVVSSDFIKKLGLRIWKKIHYLVIPAWVLMLIHGFAIGTDSSEPWALVIYLVGSSIVIALLVIVMIKSIFLRESSVRRSE
ncbi:MAG TPA: ferric reductase-like transmembrane domain-containing protein [Bacillales bacterium]|nr:ferric reductase-like transmembrane domain-containing protein [Bacillales bacterium]